MHLVCLFVCFKLFGFKTMLMQVFYSRRMEFANVKETDDSSGTLGPGRLHNSFCVCPCYLLQGHLANRWKTLNNHDRAKQLDKDRATLVNIVKARIMRSDEWTPVDPWPYLNIKPRLYQSCHYKRP